MKATFSLGMLLLALGGAPACHDDGPDSDKGRSGNEESPSARILPAPLPEVAQAAAGMGGAPAAHLKTRKAPALVALSLGRELPNVRELPGSYPAQRLRAELRFPEYPAPPGAPAGAHKASGWPSVEVMLIGQVARERALSSGEPSRVAQRTAAALVWRFVTATPALPAGAELRGRGGTDGFAVVWPDGRSYRTIPSSALRSVLEERRADVLPSVPTTVKKVGSARRLGIPVDVVELGGRMGAVRLELARIEEVGAAGPTLCQLLLAMARVAPQSNPCEDGQLPVAARFAWKEGPGLEFVVTEVPTRVEVPRSAFWLPPALGIFKPGELPPRGELTGSGTTVASATLPQAASPPAASPHSGSSAVGAARSGDKSPVARGELVIISEYDVPVYLWLDGAAAGTLDPGQQLAWPLVAPIHRYQVRDFLGHGPSESGAVPSEGPLVLGRAKVRPKAE